MDKFITVTQSNMKMVNAGTTPNKIKTIKPVPSHTSVVSKEKSNNSNNQNIINVFTDGSCIQGGKTKKQSRPAGYSCVFPEYPSYNHSAKLLGPEKTNNRAEFSACIAAFKIADQIDPKLQKLLYVYTDSELLINSVTKWLPGWKAKNWKKADGSPVKNIDLLKILDDAIKRRVVVFRHVRAHTGKKDWQSVNNDLADKLAKQAALS